MTLYPRVYPKVLHLVPFVCCILERLYIFLFLIITSVNCKFLLMIFICFFIMIFLHLQISMLTLITTFFNWMSINLLEIISGKTKVLQFSSLIRNSYFPNICINGHTIDFVHLLKCLGVMLDSRLIFSNHINYISSNCCLVIIPTNLIITLF